MSRTPLILGRPDSFSFFWLLGWADFYRFLDLLCWIFFVFWAFLLGRRIFSFFCRPSTGRIFFPLRDLRAFLLRAGAPTPSVCTAPREVRIQRLAITGSYVLDKRRRVWT